MDALKAGAKYEFNFGGIDFSKGVKVNSVIYTNDENETVDVLEDIDAENKPILRSKNDFLQFLVMLQISSSFVENAVNKFVGFANKKLNDIENPTGPTFIIEYDGSEHKITSNGELPVTETQPRSEKAEK